MVHYRRRPLRPALRIHPLTAAVAATFGAASLVPPGATAADAGIPEIIVTASRRATSIQEIPYNIAAIGSQQLEEQRLNDLADLGRVVPGLTVIDQGPRAGNVMTVRGLNTDSLSGTELLNNTSGNVVGTYIGEIPLYLDLKLKDLDRVEVLLGPQGTLYGASTLGGAVRYIPQRPRTDAFTVDVEGQAYALGHSDGLGFDGDVVMNLPLSEQLAWRVLVGSVSDPGFIDYDYLVTVPGVSNPQPDFGNPADVAANLSRKEDANSEHTLYARSLLQWTPAANIDATLGYYYQDSDIGGRQMNHVAAFGTGNYVSAYRYLEPNERQNHLVSLEVNVADLELPLLGRARLTSATGYSVFHQDGQRDQTDLLLNFETGYEGFPAFSAYTLDQADENRFNQEIRLVSDNDSRWNWIAGLFYNNFDTDAKSEEFTPGFPAYAGIDRPDNREYVLLTDDDLEEKAIFGEIGYHFTEAWQLTAGARYFDYEEKVQVCTDFPLWSGLPSGYAFSCDPNKVSDSDFIFKLNTSVDLSADLTAYATYSEGYRIGGVNSGQPCPDPLPPGPAYCLYPDEVLIKPDTTRNYEIGAHSAWLDRRLIVNGALFWIDWQDIQIASTSVNGAMPITGNGGEARSVGVELSTEFMLDEHWSLRGSYAYADAELTEDAPGVVDGVADGRDGDRLAGTPEHKGAFGLRYTTAIASGRRITADYGLTAQSDIYSKVGLRNNGEDIGGFTVHNASLSLGDEAWEATLYADNLTDKFAVTGVRQDRSYIRDVGGFALRRYHQDVLRPREVGLRFRYRFRMD